MARTKQTFTGREAKEALRKRLDYTRDYDKAHYRTFGFKFNLDTQADVIQRLEHEKSKTEYVARLVREDIIKNGAK